MVWTRLALRFLQFASSLIVIVAFSSAYAHLNQFPNVVGSNDVTFAILMSFLGMVYGLFFLVFVEILSLCMRPLLFCEQVMDFLMVLLLLIASIVLAVSDVFQHCSTHHPKLRCHDINVGVSFTFVSLAAFLATLVLSCFADRDNNGYDLAVYDDEISPLSYEYDPTPVAAATPLTTTAPLVEV
uniref:MARVEL domain-containing protein n=1 Tax=Globisporangium ultimum (strain ATCC 200006 / CBS 805.95 / DAOM BR144) TaxID=431595 RepID=K3WS83_GLOUD